MKKMYLAEHDILEIEPIMVERETMDFVYPTNSFGQSTSRIRKLTGSYSVHSTFEDAKRHLVTMVESNIDHHMDMVEQQKRKLRKVEELKDETGDADNTDEG